MTKRPARKFLSMLLALAAGLTACDSPSSVGRMTGPSMDVAGYEWDAVPLVTDVEVHGNTIIGVVGPAGGKLENRGHWISIPANAVSEDTEFTMKIVGGKNIRVDLSAKTVALGLPVKTFPTALTLGLSYYDGKGKVSDPYKLYIAYIVEGSLSGLRERQASTVYPDIYTVTAAIWHFSEYEVAVD
jgi:hypothetical protein